LSTRYLAHTLRDKPEGPHVAAEERLDLLHLVGLCIQHACLQCFLQNNMVRANFYLAMRYQDARLFGTVLTDPSLAWQPKFRADVVLPDRDVCAGGAPHPTIYARCVFQTYCLLWVASHRTWAGSVDAPRIGFVVDSELDGKRLGILVCAPRGASRACLSLAHSLNQCPFAPQIQPLVINSFQVQMMDDNLYIDTPACGPEDLIALKMNLTVCRQTLASVATPHELTHLACLC
jgi:hypothetical protein